MRITEGKCLLLKRSCAGHTLRWPKMVEAPLLVHKSPSHARIDVTCCQLIRN